MGLTREQRVLVEEGLSSSGHDVGVADGLLDGRAREALGSWQKSQGLVGTGYLTKQQSETLQALGQEARAVRVRKEEAARAASERRAREEERRRVAAADDEAFARAKRLHTESGYREYLSSYPSGRHASEARALLEEVSAAPLEVAEAEESQLGLTRVQRVLVQEGLSSLGHDVGAADGVFGRRTRSGIESYPGWKGLAETGYLTVELSEALQAFGKEARGVRLREEEAARAESERRKREADDAAFARAKRLHTAEGYREYLAGGGRHASEARALLKEVTKPEWAPGKKFRDCAGCPELVVVPEGSFLMGSPSSEEGVHRVTFARPFAVGVYEVTFGGVGCVRVRGRLWWASSLPTRVGGRGRRPVINVSWEDAKGYVEWLSRETDKEYRLLSESEWEYVARAGTKGKYHFGSRISPSRANYGRNERGTVPVGRYSANAFGLYDVHGNVWEWVEDCWNSDYHGAPSDGRAWWSGNCSLRVLRGGSWHDGPWFLRSAYRLRYFTGGRYYNYGFRVARTLD